MKYIGENTPKKLQPISKHLNILIGIGRVSQGVKEQILLPLREHV